MGVEDNSVNAWFSVIKAFVRSCGPQRCVRAQQRSRALTTLGPTQTIPFVTMLFVPLLLIVLRVIRIRKGGDFQFRGYPVRSFVLSYLLPHIQPRYVFRPFFHPPFLIGGFTISSALSKTKIDKFLITRVLAMPGTKPSWVLLAFKLHGREPFHECVDQVGTLTPLFRAFTYIATSQRPHYSLP